MKDSPYEQERRKRLSPYKTSPTEPKAQSLISILITSIIAFVIGMYSLSSAINILPENITMSKVLTITSLVLTLLFIIFIYALQTINFKLNERYYEFIMIFVTTAIGFTLSTALTEYINEKEEKEEILTIVELALNNYNSQLSLCSEIEIIDRDPGIFLNDMESQMILVQSDNREILLNTSDNNPEQIKEFSKSMQGFLGSASPLSTYMEDIQREIKSDDNDFSRATYAYTYYDRLRNDIKHRINLLKLEKKLLENQITDNEHTKAFNSEMSYWEFELINSNSLSYSKRVGDHFSYPN